MKKIIYIILLISISANAQFDKFLIASQQQFANEGSSNLILNSTFDDASNVSIPTGGWNVSGGTLNFTGADKEVRLTMSEDFTSGGDYDIEFTISGSNNARMALYAGTDNNESIQGNTTRSAGTYVVSYSHTGANRGSLAIAATDSAGADSSWSIDDVSVIKTN